MWKLKSSSEENERSVLIDVDLFPIYREHGASPYSSLDHSRRGLVLSHHMSTMSLSLGLIHSLSVSTTSVSHHPQDNTI
jgi:hypothetical protein